MKIVDVNRNVTVRSIDPRTGQPTTHEYVGVSCYGGKTIKGDSGSPVFQRFGNTISARAMGLSVLKNDNRPHSCFEPIHKIESATMTSTFLAP